MRLLLVFQNSRLSLNYILCHVSHFDQPVTSGMPPCLCAEATATTLMDKDFILTLGLPTHLYVTLDASALLQAHKTQHLFIQWQTNDEQDLLTILSLLYHCNTLNRAILLRLPDDGKPVLFYVIAL